jgi:hypothetical protein
MKFGWIIKPFENRSIKNLCYNLSEYTTAELLSKNIEVRIFNSEIEAINDDVNLFAEIGTLFLYELYDTITQDTKLFNINKSNFLIFDRHNLLNNLHKINEAVDHRNFFIENTEEFKYTYTDRGTVYDCCVCSAAGNTPTKVLDNVNLSSTGIIYVVDINQQALDLARTKITDTSRFRFVHLDLFNTDGVEEFLKTITSKNNLWFVSNIFNYVNTSLIYDYSLRFSKQQEFINSLAADNNNWDISIYTADCNAIQNTPASQLVNLDKTIDLEILPWVSLNQQN